jgi:hypothetical protein
MEFDFFEDKYYKYKNKYINLKSQIQNVDDDNNDQSGGFLAIKTGTAAIFTSADRAAKIRNVFESGKSLNKLELDSILDREAYIVFEGENQMNLVENPARQVKEVAAKVGKVVSEKAAEIGKEVGIKAKELGAKAVQAGKELGAKAVQAGKELGAKAVQAGKELGTKAVELGKKTATQVSQSINKTLEPNKPKTNVQFGGDVNSVKKLQLNLGSNGFSSHNTSHIQTVKSLAEKERVKAEVMIVLVLKTIGSNKMIVAKQI